MTPQPQPAVVATVWTLHRVLLVVSCILFVIASLCFGGIIAGWSAWAFAAGAFSAWVLSGAVP